MKLGFFIMPVHPPARNYAETLREDREAFILADKLGYCEGYCGEHLTDARREYSEQPDVRQPRLLGFTSQIKLGTAVINLPFSHPVIVAAQRGVASTICSRAVSCSGSAPASFVPMPRHSNFSIATAAPCSRRRSITSSPSGPAKRLTISRASTGTSPPRRRCGPRSASATSSSRYQKPHPPILGTATDPEFERIDRAGPARLVADLVALLAHELSRQPMEQLRQGLRRGRPQGRPRQLARRTLDFRGR